MGKTLYLIDGHAQIYRAYYARMGALSAPSGEPTRGTHVFCQMLLKLVRERKPDYLAVVLDVADETVFRRDIYPDYKAHREPPPEDFPIQFRRIMQILEALKIPILRVPGFEADDILATLARQYAAQSYELYLVSRDKDLEQLITDTVKLFDPMKDEVIDADRLYETKGWRPEQAIEVQALIGDTVDNVPGVKGIGPKTAAKLIEKYGSARGVIEHADELTPKQRENVLEFAPSLEVSRQLLTLRDDVPFEFDLAAADPARFDWAAVVPIFEELGFRRMIEQLPARNSEERIPNSELAAAEVPSAAAGSAGGESSIRYSLFDIRNSTEAVPAEKLGNYRLVNTPAALAEVARELAQQPAFALDTETTGPQPIDATLCGIALAWEVGQAVYIPTRCVHGGTLPLELVRDTLAPIFADARKPKIGHHIKYDMLVLRLAGMPVAGPLFDTMVAAFILDPMHLSYGLDRIVQRTLGHEMIAITELLGRGRDQLQMDQALLEHITEYAGQDADYTLRLRELFEPKLRGSTFERLFYEIEMPLVAVLADMEYEGISLDTDLLAKMNVELSERLAALTREAHALVGHPFNLDSTKQLGDVLFGEMGFRVVKSTAKAARSTDADTLATLAREYDSPLPKVLLEYRELQKLRGTYVEALPAARAKRTGRVHTNFHQTGAITGRLSSSDPNLQNIPIRTDIGRQIRGAFVPRSPDELLIVADYSQVELRIMAHFSQDEELIRAFAEDQDIHAFVAAQVNGVPIEQVTREMRGRAKAVNFGIIYGQSAFGLSQGTGMSRTDAQRFIFNYFERYPRVKAFINRCIEHARREGYVETILGRRREIRDMHSRNRAARAQGERLAVNTVIQGSAADLIKLAMVNLHRRIRSEELPLRLVLQVHDELVCEGPRERAAELGEIVADTMRGALTLSVPLRVDVATASSWLDAK